jgi:hypothetical protein
MLVPTTMHAGRIDFSSSYDVQQVCTNGHVTNNWTSDEARNQTFCDRCGAKTVTECRHCRGPIRGGPKHSPGPRHPQPDAHCLHCGKPFPWTESRIEAVRAIAVECEDLTLTDRKELNEILPDLIARTETPKTQLAIVRVKKLLTKGGSVFAEAVRKTLVDVVSESVRKILTP